MDYSLWINTSLDLNIKPLRAHEESTMVRCIPLWGVFPSYLFLLFVEIVRNWDVLLIPEEWDSRNEWFHESRKKRVHQWRGELYSLTCVDRYMFDVRTVMFRCFLYIGWEWCVGGGVKPSEHGEQEAYRDVDGDVRKLQRPQESCGWVNEQEHREDGRS